MLIPGKRKYGRLSERKEGEIHCKAQNMGYEHTEYRT